MNLSLTTETIANYYFEELIRAIVMRMKNRMMQGRLTNKNEPHQTIERGDAHLYEFTEYDTKVRTILLINLFQQSLFNVVLSNEKFFKALVGGTIFDYIQT
ncbi:hypothetical protein CDAR_118871 [Caerostris darwini]|uniref:Uncharacterized protein n=1 Tax=Caerostris darwini TaxID=1538125 RepID=A0AAV4VB98_9ARAC|nr:hypothetical protein CDAR_118871 [Caerostris darwini]